MVRAIAVTAVALTLGGCAAGQTGRAKPSGFLGDYAQLQAGAKGQALMVYVRPDADFAKYRKMLIDPVAIYRTAETGTIPPEEAQNLIEDLEDVLRMTLDDDYDIVTEPGPDVLRLRAAITEAEGSWRVVDGRLGDRFDDDLQAVTPKQPSSATRGFVGKAGIEAEILDAASGTRLAAAIDRRAGEHTLKPDKDEWDDVEDAFRFWAERLRDRLRELRKRA
jgi:hypothetical protein